MGFWVFFLQDGKKVDTAARVEQARSNVTEITTSIDSMRSSRDLKLADIDKCQAQIQVNKH